MDDEVRSAYQALAPIYDAFSHRNDYPSWIRTLMPSLEEHGLRRGHVLDVGCGTGRAIGPMLDLGWEVTGCDVSTAMLEVARGKAGDSVRLEVADIRELPVFGEFELVWALNDVCNHLTEEPGLELALCGMRANLCADGLLVFDAVTRSNLRAFTVESEPARVAAWTWEGLSREDPPGGIYEARISGGGVNAKVIERYRPIEEVRTTLDRVGLECLAAIGHREEAGTFSLDPSADEERDDRIIYVARAKTG